MKTDIRAFCIDFAGKITPFASSLESALRALGEEMEFEPLRHTALRLREVRHRLGTLEEKIAGQQAYLLIFGPLKSGKSTLMNAISGAYVSEVSSLPAYPALVYVKDGADRRYEATTYEGQKIHFKNGDDMSEAVRGGHRELARRLLEVEREGEIFEPARHYPDAIRRMDIELPAKNLADSGSVLVDTPGLYSRMKFGYDLMTRDFRDTAACAIFVVKTDNLFFEKVFDEFNELLDCFSRIFLVANIDTSKRDLNPDGTLQLSLEGREPGEIIKAFQSLSMSAPLREAYEEGRLNIYTIDLLKAASARLRATADDNGERNGDRPEWEDTAAQTTTESFDLFLRDLTEYLNSSDYLHEFMYDSLRFGSNLANEASEVVVEEAMGNLRDSRDQLNERLGQVREKLLAIRSIESMDWQPVFDHVHVEKDRVLRAVAEGHSEKLTATLLQSLDRWMDTDGSLRALQDGSLNRHVGSTLEEDVRALLPQLREIFEDPHGGARFSVEQTRAFEKVDVEIRTIVPHLLEDLGSRVEPRFERIILDEEEIPVRRTFWDRLLFRSESKVRRQLFGEDGQATIPADKKQKRLGGPGTSKLRGIIEEYPAQVLPESYQSYLDRVVDHYVEQFGEALTGQLKTLKARLLDRQKKLESQLVAHRQVQAVIEDLQRSLQAFTHSLDELGERYRASPRGAGAEETIEDAGTTALETFAAEDLEAMAEDGAVEPGDPGEDDVFVPEDNGAGANEEENARLGERERGL